MAFEKLFRVSLNKPTKIEELVTDQVSHTFFCKNSAAELEVQFHSLDGFRYGSVRTWVVEGEGVFTAGGFRYAFDRAALKESLVREARRDVDEALGRLLDAAALV